MLLVHNAPPSFSVSKTLILSGDTMFQHHSTLHSPLHLQQSPFMFPLIVIPAEVQLRIVLYTYKSALSVRGHHFLPISVTSQLRSNTSPPTPLYIPLYCRFHL